MAGFAHSSAALSASPVHAGLNLCNDGFATGIVAAVLLPVIIAIQSRTQPGPSGAERAPAKEDR